MKCLIGFILFWIGIGMLIMLIIPKCLVAVVIAAALILIGYSFFCGDS